MLGVFLDFSSNIVCESTGLWICEFFLGILEINLYLVVLTHFTPS